MSKKVFKKFDFKKLFVLDLANNHQGDLNHGIKIIQETAKVVKKNKIRAGIKFQFRNLDTFIDKGFKGENKHIGRFKSTFLSANSYKQLKDEVVKNKLISICTPFDESSVKLIADMRFDILKIASCSAKDWPLLEAAAKVNLPIIASTGGLSIEEIDNLVSFFEHKGVDFAIMHCVSIYPSPNESLSLDKITSLKKRYPEITIGWSTHEDPENNMPILVAIGKGAEIFERHIGLRTKKYKLNQYSSDMKNLHNWFLTYKEGIKICEKKTSSSLVKIENESINSLKRGVFAKKNLKAKQYLTEKDVYFSFPMSKNQLESGNWNSQLKLNSDISKGSKILNNKIITKSNAQSIILKKTIHKVRAMLNEAKIFLDSSFTVEYSHHHGLKKFDKIGCVIINCFNRSYCKKLIIQLPGQNHPLHYHEVKEETFQVLHGVMDVLIDGKQLTLYPGQTSLVQPGVWHGFSTKIGCIFEEVSTTHMKNDSFYKEKIINNKSLNERKTIVDHWGRFSLRDIHDQ